MLNHAAEYLEDTLNPIYAPFPKWGDPQWKALPAEAIKHLMEEGNRALEGEWPSVRASLYMDFERTGQRGQYEAAYFNRRNRLYQMMIAECIEAKGRFIPAIIDAVWMICEETSWVIPPHNNLHHEGLTQDLLPDFRVKYPFIDLFSALTAASLTWVYYFLHDRLAQESELIPLRIEKEIKERILAPYLALDDMYWMGLNHDHPVNNWNPCINSDVMVCFLIIEKDRKRRIEGLRKVARTTQRFLSFYAEDGGCDEGPGYFKASGAAILDILEIFDEATYGKFYIFNEPLIGNMAEYIHHVHIDGQYYVNFADSPCQIADIPAALLIRAGKSAHRPDLIAFAKKALREGWACKPWEIDIKKNRKHHRHLKDLLTYEPDDGFPIWSPQTSSHYFPGIQVAVGRSAHNLFFAAKGGCNDESHNHNDIGSYILYAKGQPCLIDVGVGDYTKKTFSPQRYEIWSMQSGFHNTAIINDCDQLPGPQYAAHSAAYSSNFDQVNFALNIENAYGPEAQLSSYRRSFTLDQARNVLTIRDVVQFTGIKRQVSLPVMCYNKPLIRIGSIDLGGVTLHFNPHDFTVTCEEIRLDDPDHYPISDWNRPAVYRLLLNRTRCLPCDHWTITYSLD